MGEVYRARDTRLDRIVAVKVLPEGLAAEPQFRERFDREARAISALEHPHICALYDVGQQDGTAFLVMQYLEGETLADRLTGGALALDHALQIAIEVADALATAHKAGIVHRDLKPGNIMLTKAGSKLLDFGLAKAGPSAFAGAQASNLPTTPPLTQMGSILGTIQYMAPEQIEGQEADARSDIFAFGAVAYEMLTGRKAFEGKSQPSVMAAILNRDPAPMSAIVPRVPAPLDHVVSRCLAKDPDERWQTARDVLHELRWASEDRSAREPAIDRAPRRGGMIQRAAWPVAVLALIAAAVIGGVHWFEAQPVERAVQFEVFPPKGAAFSPGTPGARMAISPDGTVLAFGAATGGSGTNQIWVRRLNALNATLLAGTDGADTMFWSPDSRFVGFFANQSLKKIDITGGPAQTLCPVPGQAPSGSWNEDGIILFSSVDTGGIRRVSAEGGDAVQVTTIESALGRHAWPRFLPYGRRFVFFDPDPDPEKHGAYLGSLDSKTVTRILKADSVVEFAPPASLLFVRETALYAQAVDPESIEPRGDPVRILGAVSVDRANGRAGFSVAGNGVLVFAGGPAGSDLEFRLFDRNGKILGVTAGPWAYRGLDLSPDGKRIAAHRHDDQGGDIWITELDTGSNSRFTFDPSQHNASPVWSPDGERIAFGSLRRGSWGIYQKSSSGVGDETLLFESKLQILPIDWSRDGQSIVFWLNDPNTLADLWHLPLQGDRKPVPFLDTPALEQHGQLSPDGRWLAYTSNDSGSAEVYVQSFPVRGTKYQLTSNGATFPRWRHDGKEILFMDGQRIMGRTVQPAGAGLKFGPFQFLFDSRFGNWAHSETGGGIYHAFAVSRDGQRFAVPLARGSGDAPTPLTVVLDWRSVLRD